MASLNEQLLYAAKTDSSELLQSILTGHPPDEFDINVQDGLGNTPLHYAASMPSPTVLEELLDFEGTDVDLVNRLEGATPLHLAVKLEDEGARYGVVEMLLDAGADPRIKDKQSNIPADYLSAEVSKNDAAIVRMLAIAMAEFNIGISSADIANDDEGDVDDRGSDIASD